MGKKPFSDEQYEALAKKYAKREKKESAETGAPDYELKLKLQKQLAEELAKKKEASNESPLNGAYASGAGGAPYVSTAGAFQRLQDDISAGIQADLANRKAEAEAAKKQEKFKKATKKFKNKDYSLPKFEVTSISEFDKKNNDNPFYQ